LDGIFSLISGMPVYILMKLISITHDIDDILKVMVFKVKVTDNFSNGGITIDGLLSKIIYL